MALASMSFILPTITGILAFMAFIFTPPIYGGWYEIGMGGEGKQCHKYKYIYIYIYNI